MPWKEVSAVSEKEQFVQQSLEPGVNFSQLCRSFGISRPTGYYWRSEYRKKGHKGLHEQSRRPNNSPNKTSQRMENLILSVSIFTKS